MTRFMVAALVILALTGEARAQGTLSIPNVFGARTTAPIAQFDANWGAIASYVNAREITFGTLAARPTAGTAGRFYVATDQAAGTTYADNGTQWIQLGAGVALFTVGSIPFAGASGLTENNANLFWNNSTFFLGVGTTGQFVDAYTGTYTKGLAISGGATGDITTALQIQGARSGLSGTFANFDIFHKTTAVTALTFLRGATDDSGGFQILTKKGGTAIKRVMSFEYNGYICIGCDDTTYQLEIVPVYTPAGMFRVGDPTGTVHGLIVDSSYNVGLGGLASAANVNVAVIGTLGAAYDRAFYVAPTMSPAVGSDASPAIFGGTLTKAAAGAHANFASATFQAPTIGAGAATVTNASTLDIIEAPTGGGTNLALRVRTGNVAISTVTSGTWNGTAIAGLYGGTGLTTAAVGDLIYASATTPTWSRLADVAVGSYLRSGGVNTAPLWSTLILPNAATTGDLLVASSTNTITGSSGYAGPYAIGGATSALARVKLLGTFVGSSDVYGVEHGGTVQPTGAGSDAYGAIWNLTALKPAAGAGGTAAAIRILPPTIAGAGDFATNTGLFIANAPTNGTANWSILVNAGVSRFDGGLNANGNAGVTATFTMCKTGSCLTTCTITTNSGLVYGGTCNP